MRSRYWGPFRQDYYSICSAHQLYEESCLRCRTGHWRNRWLTKLNHWLYVLSPTLWQKWANRRWFNPSRRFLEKTFPNLKD